MNSSIILYHLFDVADEIDLIHNMADHPCMLQKALKMM